MEGVLSAPGVHGTGCTKTAHYPPRLAHPTGGVYSGGIRAGRTGLREDIMTAIAVQLANDFLNVALGDDVDAARRAVDYANAYMGGEGPSTAVTDAAEDAPFAVKRGDSVMWVSFWQGAVDVSTVAVDGGPESVEQVAVVDLTDAQRATLKDRGADLWAI